MGILARRSVKDSLCLWNIGVVADVKEQFIIVEVDNNVKIRVDKTCIVKDVTDVAR